MRRRRLIATIGSAGALGLAGCTDGGSDPDDGSPTETPTDPGNPTDPGSPTDPGTPSDPETPTGPETSFAMTGFDCGTEVNRAEVTFDDGTVTVEGATWGNDACYVARLDSATVEDGTLTVRVVTERDAPEDEACAQCVAEIDYRATVEVEPAPERVVVSHDGETVAEATP